MDFGIARTSSRTGRQRRRGSARRGGPLGALDSDRHARLRDDGRRHRRHDRVHGAGTGEGRRGRPAGGHLRVRTDPLRHAVGRRRVETCRSARSAELQKRLEQSPPHVKSIVPEVPDPLIGCVPMHRTRRREALSDHGRTGGGARSPDDAGTLRPIRRSSDSPLRQQWRFCCSGPLPASGGTSASSSRRRFTIRSRSSWRMCRTTPATRRSITRSSRSSSLPSRGRASSACTTVPGSGVAWVCRRQNSSTSGQPRKLPFAREWASFSLAPSAARAAGTDYRSERCGQQPEKSSPTPAIGRLTRGASCRWPVSSPARCGRRSATTRQTTCSASPWRHGRPVLWRWSTTSPWRPSRCRVSTTKTHGSCC